MSQRQHFFLSPLITRQYLNTRLNNATIETNWIFNRNTHSMPVAPGPSRRFVLLLIAVSAVIAFTFVYSFRSQEVGVRHPLAGGSGGVPAGVAPAYAEIQESTLSGHVIAPKLGNETAKYVAMATSLLSYLENQQSTDMLSIEPNSAVQRGSSSTRHSPAFLTNRRPKRVPP
jgi:hypothetical protein